MLSPCWLRAPTGDAAAGFLLHWEETGSVPKALTRDLGPSAARSRSKIISSCSPQCRVLRYPQPSLLPGLPRSLCEGLCSPAAFLPNPSSPHLHTCSDREKLLFFTSKSFLGLSPLHLPTRDHSKMNCCLVSLTCLSHFGLYSVYSIEVNIMIAILPSAALSCCQGKPCTYLRLSTVPWFPEAPHLCRGVCASSRSQCMGSPW